jgi:hypothetical protein
MSELHLTSPGTAVGTIAHMSPEQAAGDELDPPHRSVFVRAVVYEMVTGLPAFSGNTSAMVFDAILHKGAYVGGAIESECAGGTRADHEQVLEKDRKLRYQSASEVGVDLKRPRRAVESGRTGAVQAYTGTASIAAASPSAKRKVSWRMIPIGGSGCMAASSQPAPAPDHRINPNCS